MVRTYCHLSEIIKKNNINPLKGKGHLFKGMANVIPLDWYGSQESALKRVIIDFNGNFKEGG